MRKLFVNIGDARGSVLIIAMLMLIILSLIGVSASNNSTFDMVLSGNEKFHKITFYGADGGTETSISLIEENISCPVGFADPPNALYNPNLISATDDIVLGQVVVVDGNEDFYLSESDPYLQPSVTQHAYFYYPGDFYTPNPGTPIPLSPANLPASPRVNQTFNGNTRYSTGSAIQMAAGYEGKGKGAGGSGAEIVYDLPAQRFGIGNECESCVRKQWVHKIGQEGECTYR